MTTRRLSEEDEEDEKSSQDGWKAWVRDIAVAVIIVVVILAAIYAYTSVWPPLVVVESGSMQHSETTSYIGVIDTGDLVLVKAAPYRSDVVTYLQGRATGYSTYGDYGDVIIFHLAYDPAATPIIHRAIMYVIPNGTSGAVYADVPQLALLPPLDWGGITPAGYPTHSPYDLQAAWVSGMGFNHNLNITFDFTQFRGFFARGPGYITMGDNNAFTECSPNVPCRAGYDTEWFPIQSDIIGVVRGEIPWFGLIKLLVSPSSTCAHGWGDPCAPANSWTDLALSIVFLIALPFIVEGLAWAWSTYAWPRLKPRLRRLQGKPEPPEPRPLPKDEDEEDAPRGGSSGP